jgi:hypothetical protein
MHQPHGVFIPVQPVHKANQMNLIERSWELITFSDISRSKAEVFKNDRYHWGLFVHQCNLVAFEVAGRSLLLGNLSSL